MGIPASAGYAGLFLWVFLGESGVPLFVPAELVLFAAGVAAAHHAASLSLSIALALAADVLGGVALFLLIRFGRGRSGRIGRLERFLERATHAAHTVGGRSPLRIAVGRSVPFLRIPSAFAAALAGVPLGRYAGALIAGGAAWVLIFLGGGFLLTREAFHV